MQKSRSPKKKRKKIQVSSRRRRRAKRLPLAERLPLAGTEVKQEEGPQEEMNWPWSMIISMGTTSSSSQPAATRSGDYNDKVLDEPEYMQALMRLLRRDPTIDTAEGAGHATPLQGTDDNTLFRFVFMKSGSRAGETPEAPREGSPTRS